MDLREKAVYSGLVLAAVLLLIQRNCGHGEGRTYWRVPPHVNAVDFKENGTINVQTTDHKSLAVNVPTLAPVRITLNEKTRELEVDISHWGFVTSPGLGLGYLKGPFIGIDCQLLYVYDFGFGLGAGLSFPPDPLVRVYAEGLYNLRKIGLYNTSIFLAISHQKEVFGGLRLRF